MDNAGLDLRYDIMKALENACFRQGGEAEVQAQDPDPQAETEASPSTFSHDSPSPEIFISLV
jgi:hypothetical protein